MKIAESLRRRLLAGAFTTILLRLLGASISFTLTLVVARKAGVNDSGNFFFCIALLAFLASFVTFGLQVSIIKLVALRIKAQQSLLPIIKKSFLVIVLLTFAVNALLVLFDMLVQHELIASNLTYILFALLPFSLLLLISAIFQGAEMVKSSMLSLNIGYQLVLLLSILFYSSIESNLLMLHLVLSLYFVALLHIVSLVYRLVLSQSSLKPCGVSLISLLTLSLPFLITQLAGQFSNFAGQYLMSIYADTEAIGLFAVVSRIAIALSIFVMAVNRVIAPKIAVLYEDGKLDELHALIRFFNRILLVFSLFVTAICIAFAPEILGLFGEGFIRGQSLLSIVIIGQLVASVTGIFVFLLQMTGAQKSVKNLVIISVFICVLIGVVIIPEFGAIGAAIMYSMNLFIIGVGSAILASKRLNLKIWQLY